MIIERIEEDIVIIELYFTVIYVDVSYVGYRGGRIVFLVARRIVPVRRLVSSPFRLDERAGGGAYANDKAHESQSQRFKYLFHFLTPLCLLQYI